MASITRRVFAGLTRAAFGRGKYIHNGASTVRLSSVRPLAVSSQRSALSTEDEKEVKDEPIKFSTSKASHRTWKVDRAMGSQFERPVRKVIPISLFFVVFLTWCVLRQQSDIDTQLEKDLSEHFSDEEEEQNKSS